MCHVCRQAFVHVCLSETQNPKFLNITQFKTNVRVKGRQVEAHSAKINKTAWQASDNDEHKRMYAFNRCTWLLYNHFCCRAFCPLFIMFSVTLGKYEDPHHQDMRRYGHHWVLGNIGKHNPRCWQHTSWNLEKKTNTDLWLVFFSDLTLSCSLYGSTGQGQSTCKLSKFRILTDAL